MIVTLDLEDQSIDITEYLDDETDLDLGQEHELKMFQRTVDDVRLKCSNLGGEFTQWLGSPSSVKPRIKIEDGGRVLFRGEIQQPIDFDVRDEWISFDCFSMTKSFWDLCKQTRVSKAVPSGQETRLYTTVAELFAREISRDRFGCLIAGYQISEIYAPRFIRFWGYTADQTTGNNGRYKDLDPRLTVDELLKAMTIYYNADIFVDPESQLLVMQTRDEVLNNVDHQLDDELEDDDEITVQVYDEKVDYIGLTLNFAKPGAPTPRRTGHAGLGAGLWPGRYVWAVTFLYRNGDTYVESGLGDQSGSLDLPPMPTGWGTTSGRYEVYMDIPVGPSGCVGRKIYRTKNGGIGSLYLVGQVDDNSSLTFADILPHDQQTVLAPTSNTGGTTWIRYDEDAAGWDQPIIADDIGLNTPLEAVIFDVTPRLRFLANPLGYGIEIAAVYSLGGTTRIRAKGEHRFSKGTWIQISGTNSTPSVDGFHVVGEVYDDNVTFEIFDANTPIITTPGTGGTVIRSEDIGRTVDPQTAAEVAPESLLDVFAFFGNEKGNLDQLQRQWKNLFRSRKRVKVSVKGTSYRIGDSASLNRSYNGHTIGKCVIKKATNSLLKERTKLEMLTL